MKYLAFHCISDASFHIFSLVLEIEGKKYSDTLENIWKLSPPMTEKYKI